MHTLYNVEAFKELHLETDVAQIAIGTHREETERRRLHDDKERCLSIERSDARKKSVTVLVENE